MSVLCASTFRLVSCYFYYASHHRQGTTKRFFFGKFVFDILHPGDVSYFAFLH